MLDKKDTTLLKLDCKSKDKVYDMLFGKADACLKNAKTVALLYLGSPYYMTRALEEYNIEEVNIFTTKDFKFIYEPFENAERVKIWYVDNVKDTFKECDMKFDCIIMNPPYQRNLHLKILAESIKHLKDDGTCVNLSPILWIEDPHAHMKQKSNLFKFKTSIIDKCYKLEVIDRHSANKQFDIGLYSNLGIYACKKTAKGIDSLNFWKRNFEDWEVKLFEKVYAMKCHLADKCDNDKRDGIRVPIAFIAGNRGTLPIYKDIAYVIDGYNKDGIDWTKCKNNGGYEKKEGIPIPVSIKFNTENEAQNFYDSWKTTFNRWLSRRFLFDQHIQLQFLPWMEDYTKPWNDIRFYKYFDITSEEQKAIEKMMEKYAVK